MVFHGYFIGIHHRKNKKMSTKMSSMYVKQRQTKGMTTSQLQGLSGEISYNYIVRFKPCDNNRCHRLHFQRKTQRDKKDKM